jgi:hypothetical protein
MIDGTGVSSKPHVRLLAVVVGAMLIYAAQAQVQQPVYPTPNQPYPSPAPAYPAPNPGYPTPNPGYPTPNQPYPAPNPSYPNPSYPAPPSVYSGNTQPYAGYPNTMPAPQQSHFVRDLFAGTIAAVLQTLTGGLAGAIGGRIMDWFTHRGQNSPAGYNAAAGYPNRSQYPNTVYPSTSAPGYPTPAYPSTTTPGYPNATYPTGTNPASAYPGPAQAYPAPTSAYPTPTTAYPNGGTQYPNPAYPNGGLATPPYPSTGYPSAAGAGAAASYGSNQYGAAPVQVYDAHTGQLVTGGANPYTARGTGMESSIYAGIAYEVDTVSADGHTTPINTLTYEFHTGDKFMVYYRPSLPGHMEIYNVNPKGQQTLIDSSNMAAGQMVGLGPYQFTNQSGDETLRLVLSPCSSPQLLAATRDIVRMDAPLPTSPTSAAVKLGSCGAPTPRGLDVHTRDIEKVAVDGTTSFALDPISNQELSSGQVTPREATIVFHHR